MKNKLALVRTDSKNPDFIRLVALLDKDLAIRDGEDNDFYAAFNKIDKINHAIVVYFDNAAAGIGGIKQFSESAVEVKRMYVVDHYRGNGAASMVLSGLEEWARELGYSKCVLETGIKQPEAIQLYRKNNYETIPNYGQYAGIANSFCFEKAL